MIEEITLTRRVQTPTPPNEWLYREQPEDGYRYFTKRVLLGKDAAPWPECTNSERLAWQQAWDESHPAEVEEPTDPTPESEQPENEERSES